MFSEKSGLPQSHRQPLMEENPSLLSLSPCSRVSSNNCLKIWFIDNFRHSCIVVYGFKSKRECGIEFIGEAYKMLAGLCTILLHSLTRFFTK